VKRSNRLVILVGVLLAVLAFVAIVILLNNTAPPSGPTAEEPALATVLVAAEAVEIGEEVTPDMVEEREIPLEAVQSGALIDSSQLANRIALFALPAGAQVTEALFGGDVGGVDIEGQLLPGEKAYAVQFDPVTGMNFLIQQGDHVDVILTLDFASGTIAGSAHLRANDTEIVRTVKAVLQNKRVLYVSATNIPPPPTIDEEGNEVPPPATESPGSIIVILAGTDADAELLTFAQRGAGEVGALTLTLRQAIDDAVEETTGITLADIFETYGLVIPTEVEELAEPAEEVAP
jgi:Flp pilus assembly protein CpaB